MPNDKQSRAELVLIPFAYCCGSVDVAACDCASPNHGTALVSSVSNALAQTLSGVDAVDLGMLKSGDMLGSEVGAAIYAAIESQASRIEALEAENARLREALEWYADPEVYRPHPQGIAFDRRDLSFCARSALNLERSEK